MVGILKAHLNFLPRCALRRGALAVAAVYVLTGAALAGCRAQSIEDANYVICEFAATDGIELFLRDAQGATLGQFDRVR